MANATDTYLSGSNLAMAGFMKVGTVMSWRFSMTKTATGTVTPQLILRVGTGATITDAARCSFTFPSIQTAATDTGFIDVDAVVRASGATGVLQATAMFNHKGGATGFATLAGPQIVQVLSTPFDITPASTKIGFSCNPGATGAWTFQVVDSQAVNLP